MCFGSTSSAFFERTELRQVSPNVGCVSRGGVRLGTFRVIPGGVESAAWLQISLCTEEMPMLACLARHPPSTFAPLAFDRSSPTTRRVYTRTCQVRGRRQPALTRPAIVERHSTVLFLPPDPPGGRRCTNNCEKDHDASTAAMT